MSHLEIERARREREQKQREDASSDTSNRESLSSQEKEGSVTLKYPMLTKSNYAAWAIKMEVFMMAQGVWEPIESEGLVDKRRDKMALAAIYQGIGEDTLLQLGAKKTAKEAWNTLKVMNQGAEKVKEVRAQTLWREFEALRMGDSETVEDFSGKLTIIVNKLRSLGEPVEDEKVIKKMLRSTSSKFLQIVSAIEEFSDLKTKSVEEVIGSLKAHEERLLLWRHDFRKSGDDESKPQKKDKSKIKCYSCGQMGHYASECPTKERDEKANLTQEDEGPSLLLLETCVPELLPAEESEIIMLQENTNESETKESKVRFGDGSMASICGQGSILFQCKNTEHTTIQNVYYIPRLKSNIISLGQLDEAGNSIVIGSGHLKLYDRRSRLVVDVVRGANRLYIANLKLATPINLLAKLDNESWAWHARFGHLNFDSLRKLSRKGMVKGLPSIDQANKLCDGCLVGKQHRTSFPKQTEFRANRPWSLFTVICVVQYHQQHVEALGFKQCPHEHALYKRKDEGKLMIVGVYVDDLILTGENQDVIENFKSEMQQKFDMTDLGLLSFYLGIEVKQTTTSISICQTGYAKKILEKMGVGECNPCKLPMEPRTKLSKVVDGEALVDATLYRSLIGSLRYLVNTRPDITFSVGVLSRFMEKPTTTHMAAVKQVLRYIKGTLNSGCVFSKKQPDMSLVGYCDSDLAGDIDDRKSTTGILFFSWQQSSNLGLAKTKSCSAFVMRS
ncbi:hypothetical protein GH714_035170 [Hevea brasiliensis]|uniref:CCHC-type domain-containing protein n=1 Tax=Hevea brasiliensis TaxID=3981 RepID=A0A6A6KY66_HEVBR|nr:hypothetical protein GH714_035170 [Hevea brasiliensis]